MFLYFIEGPPFSWLDNLIDRRLAVDEIYNERDPKTDDDHRDYPVEKFEQTGYQGDNS